MSSKRLIVVHIYLIYASEVNTNHIWGLKDIETSRQTKIYRHTYMQTDRHTGGQTCTHAGRKEGSKEHRLTYGQVERQAGR